MSTVTLDCFEIKPRPFNLGGPVSRLWHRGHMPSETCKARLERWVRYYQVKSYEPTRRNLLSVLSQGGAPKKDVSHVMRRYFGDSRGCLLYHYGLGNPFDHCEAWGIDRRP